MGVGDFCDYPAEAKKLPRVGGYLDPNLERFLTLSPDLVIVSGRHEKVDEFCRREDIGVLHLSIDNIDGIFAGIRKLGEITGREKKAEALLEEIDAGLARVRAQYANAPRPRVFACINRAPGSLGSLYTVGGNTFVSELLAVAGGSNIFSDVTLPYPEASKESLLVRAPEVILDLRPGEDLSPTNRERLLRDWDVFKSVPAVAEGRVYILTEDCLLLPGPRVVQAAETLARYLHGKGDRP